MVDAYATYNHSSNANHPSFSSTLLDSIYRSIDQGEDGVVIYTEAMRMKQSCSSENGGANVRLGFKTEEEMANFRRACMIEKWMEKKVTENGAVRRKSATDSQIKRLRKDSSSSSSDSSYGGGFFSSPVQRLKPVRTGSNEKLDRNRTDFDFNFNRRDQSEQKSKHEGGFLKTKSRALKIYGDLKKVKQPISPGGKVAAFLNSIFTGKSKIASNDDVSPSLKTSTTTCSSASSFSRSCLSKTPSSRGKSSNGPKRSVRFSPVSMIIDDDHHKSNNKASNLDAMEKNRRVDEAARDLIRNYQKKILQSENVKSHVENRVFEQDEDEDDDVASCASSDLFELDNLSAIGMDQRYTEELPVYETTHLHTNRAIANGLIL